MFSANIVDCLQFPKAKPIRLMEKEELLLERQKVLDLLKMGFETEVDLDLPHQLDSNRDQAVAALRKKQELRFKPLQQLLKEVDNEVDQLPVRDLFIND